MPDISSQAESAIENHRVEGLPLGVSLTMPHYEGLSLVNLPGTIAQLLEVPPFGQPPLDSLISDHLGGPYTKVVLLLVDALGYTFFMDMISSKQDSVWGCYADRAVFSPITSICPSTTASALTTLWTGEGSASHGVIGYEMWSKELGMVINNILHSPANAKKDVGGLSRAGFDPTTFLPNPLLGPHLRAYDVDPTTFIHGSIAHSGLSVMQMRDVKLKTYVNEADLCISLADHINSRQGTREYIYVYYSDVDTLMHRYDIADARVAYQFGAFSSLFERGFLSKLTQDSAEETLLILTADHGSIATPAMKKFNLAHHPKLTSYLVMQPTCEHRLPILHIKPNCVSKVRDYFAKTWPDDFFLVDSKAALEGGLFGKGPYIDGVYDRLGDLIVIARGHAYLWWSPTPNLMAGRHGGLSAEEMLIPFYALPLRNLFNS
jgi:hypothetical protein